MKTERLKKEEEKMDQKWLVKYYKSIGWSEHRITDFLRRASVLEKIKEEQIKCMAK